VWSMVERGRRKNVAAKKENCTKTLRCAVRWTWWGRKISREWNSGRVCVHVGVSIHRDYDDGIKKPRSDWHARKNDDVQMDEKVLSRVTDRSGLAGQLLTSDNVLFGNKTFYDFSRDFIECVDAMYVKLE